MGWSRRRYRNWRDSAAGWFGNHSAWVSQSGPKSTTTTPRDTSIRIGARARRARTRELVTQLAGRDVEDWRRSLWKAWTIDGLAGGRWALAVKMSPVLTDRGHGVASVWEARFDPAGRTTQQTYVEGRPAWGPVPSLSELVTDTMSEIIENSIAGTWMAAEAATDVLQAMRHRTRGTPVDRLATPSTSGPVPRTVFNAPLTKRRSMAFASIRLADVGTVSEAFRSSTANVVLAACSMSMRAWMQRYVVIPSPGAFVDASPAVRSSRRSGEGGKIVGNGPGSPTSSAGRPGTGAHQPPQPPSD